VNLNEIIRIIDGTVLVGQDNLDREIPYCGASDLMSDVLSHMKPGGLLLTAQTNPQCIRTAEMSEVAAVVFVRGKRPDPDGVLMAEKLGLPLITSPLGMYQLCGRLDRAGLQPVM
jgi:predicted transcriptional regulator